jgi:meiotic recombination protein DMC1
VSFPSALVARLWTACSAASLFGTHSPRCSHSCRRDDVTVYQRRYVYVSLLTSKLVSYAVYAVYGEYRTGKTQLAHTMSVIAQLPPDLGGASGKVRIHAIQSVGKASLLFHRLHTSIRKANKCFPFCASIITDAPSGTFRPDRIRSIAERFGVDGDMALENILYGTFSKTVACGSFANDVSARAFNSEHQVRTIF